MKYLSIFLLSLLLIACSDEEQDLQGKHVWKQQTDTIDKAKEVEKIMMDAAEETREAIEEQSQ